MNTKKFNDDGSMYSSEVIIYIAIKVNEDSIESNRKKKIKSNERIPSIGQ